MAYAVENWVPYLLYFAPVALIVLYFSRTRKHRQRSHLEAQAEALAAGLDAPISLHPVIDHAKCIGCEACVHACPEFPAHQVLGVVRGKARLVSASDCIGHGACKTACPVGAIRLVYGSAERGVDIPQVKPTFETNVPGIYIAGELGGMGLIRNAIEQGRQAVDHIVASLDDARKAKSKDVLDLLIIGAGPAGLSAALAAKAAELRYLAIDQDSLGGTVAHFPRRKLVMTAPAKLAIVGEMKFAETSKEALMEFWEGVAHEHRLQVACQERAISIEGELGAFAVKTSAGVRSAHTVLLALGRRGTPRKLDVAGEDLPKVVYRLTDPAQYRGRKVLVVGGGDSAVEAALALSEQPDTDVTLSYRSEAFTRAKPKNRARIDAAAKEGDVRLLLGSTLREVTERAVHLEHKGRSISLANDAVLVCAGGVLPTPFLKEIGIRVETKYGTQ
jgi:thioredoxin reductase/Pyruvate/2-oxoacid:ferredoxin oxidoreductase delta subunit